MQPKWIKARRSQGNSNCVEVGRLDDETIGVRDSKNPDGAVLKFTRDEWAAFVDGVTRREFDDI